jgi:integrase
MKVWVVLEFDFGDTVPQVKCDQPSGAQASPVFEAKTGVDLLTQVDAWIVATRELDGQAEYHVRQAARWVRDWLEHVKAHAAEISPASCIEWLRDMTRGGTLAPQTIRNRMSACRRFAGWMLIQGLIQSNPWAHVPGPRGRAGQGRDAFTDAEVQRLIDHATQQITEGASPAIRASAKNRANLYRLLSLTGIRRGEAHAQLWSDIDLEAGTMVVSLDKARRRDHIPLSHAAVELLREMRKAKTGPKVFARTVSYKGLATDLKGAGMSGRYGFHSFRCGYITESFENGTPPELIQRLVRHRSIDQTHRYLRHREPRLREAAESRGGKISKNSPLKTSTTDRVRTDSAMANGATIRANISATSARIAPTAVESTTRASLRCVRGRSINTVAVGATGFETVSLPTRAERLLAAALLLTQHAHPEGALVLMHEAQLLLTQQEPSHGSQSIREDC